MDISFELYKIFYHAAVSGSFSTAAEKLYITQSAVSQSIKSLEKKIGRQLFYRKARRVRLTGEGELLFRHVEQAYNFIKTAEGKINDMQNLESGQVKIGIGDTACKYFLIPYLEKFIRKYPKIKVQVINRTSPQIIDTLKAGMIDFGIITLPVSDRDITVREFKEVEDMLVASARFHELKHKKLGFHELKEYPLLMLQSKSATRSNLDGFFKEKGIEIVPEVELESIDLLVEFARIGLGIAHVLRESAAGAIERGELFEIKTTEPLPRRKLGIVTMRDVPLSRSSEEFVGFLTHA